MNDYLDRVEQQLTQLTERGAHQRLRARRPALGRAGAGAGSGGPRPPRRRNEALAFLAAAAVVAAVVAIVLVNAHTRRHRTATPSRVPQHHAFGDHEHARRRDHAGR